MVLHQVKMLLLLLAALVVFFSYVIRKFIFPFISLKRSSFLFCVPPVTFDKNITNGMEQDRCDQTNEKTTNSLYKFNSSPKKLRTFIAIKWTKMLHQTNVWWAFDSPGKWTLSQKVYNTISSGEIKTVGVFAKKKWSTI